MVLGCEMEGGEAGDIPINSGGIGRRRCGGRALASSLDFHNFMEKYSKLMKLAS